MMPVNPPSVAPAASIPCGTTPVVFVVDDDISVRESVELLLQSAGWRSETYSSAGAFLTGPGNSHQAVSSSMSASPTSTGWSCRLVWPAGRTCQSSSSAGTAMCR